MARSSPLIASLAALAGLLAACGKTDAGAPPAPEVVVQSVEKKDVEIASEWVGTTTGFVNAEIYPKVQGYLLRQAYRDGGVVQEGDLLFEIDPRQFKATLDEASGQLARARAALAKFETDVARYTPLAAEGAVSQQELDNAVQARAAARAQVDSARASVEQAQLNLQWTQVKSPISGVAGIASAQVGNLVGPQTLLTHVSQLDPIKVTFPISEIEYLRFADRARSLESEAPEAQPATLELILANGEVYPERGRLSVAGLAVTTTTGTIEVQGVFPNPGNLLRPGQYAKVRAITERIPQAIVIPQRAVRDLQGLTQVAVLGSDDKATFKKVELGPAKGSDYVVTAGLAPGDRIVVEGLQKVRDGALVRPMAPQVPSPAAVASPPAGPAGE